MPLVNLTASRTSRSPISVDTFYLIPPRTLLCLQEWMTQMMKRHPLQECMTKTLPLQECLYPDTTIMINADDDLDAESDHDSIDPNEADNNSSKPSIHSTRSHIPVHSTTSEPPQHPLGEEEPDNTELPELETQVPILHHSERFSLPPIDHIPQMGGKTYIMNIQTKPIKMKRKV